MQLCAMHHRKFTCNFTFFQRQLASGYQGENLPVYPKSTTNFIAWSEYYQNGLRVTKNKITSILKLLKKDWNHLELAKKIQLNIYYFAFHWAKVSLKLGVELDIFSLFMYAKFTNIQSDVKLQIVFDFG